MELTVSEARWIEKVDEHSDWCVNVDVQFKEMPGRVKFPDFISINEKQ